MGTLRISVAESSPESVKGTLTLWRPPRYIGFQAPVPKPPDYSTRAKVTALCGGNVAAWLKPAVADKSFSKLYRALQRSITTT